MKKTISLILVCAMALSMIPTALATTDHTSGTMVEYVGKGNESYTITVPAQLEPGASGTVTLEGSWADNRIITVTADSTVTLSNSIKTTDQKVLDVMFPGITQKGSNTGSQKFTEEVSIANIENALFGTWSGKFNYNVAIEDAPVLEGDGQTFYKMAPSTLSFRSNAPLDEFQEVRVNGEVIDPSNYTLTEGSTIVTLNIDYLDTLNVNDYEITVVSDSGSPSAGFDVVEPQLSDYGVYYNQPYFGKEDSLDTWYMSLTFYEDNIVSYAQPGTPHEMIFPITSISTLSEWAETAGASPEEIEQIAIYWGIDVDAIVFMSEYKSEPLPICAILSATEVRFLSSDCNVFSCKTDVYMSDGEYNYALNEAEDVYYASVQNRNKSTYKPVLTNVYNKPVVLSETYEDCESLTSITIPDGITTIGKDAFKGCDYLANIYIPDSVNTIGDSAFVIYEGHTHVPCNVYYDGTIEQWLNISFEGAVSNPCSYGGNLYASGELIADLTIPNSITEINLAAFRGCKSITTLNIPVSVVKIANIAFFDCTNLATINYDGTVDQWNTISCGTNWNKNILATEVVCSDGTISLT